MEYKSKVLKNVQAATFYAPKAYSDTIPLKSYVSLCEEPTQIQWIAWNLFLSHSSQIPFTLIQLQHIVFGCSITFFCHWYKICHTDLSWHVCLDFSIWIKAMVDNFLNEQWFKIVFCWHCAGQYDLILLDFVDVAVANIVSLKKFCNSVIAATTFSPQVKVSNYRGLLG